ncbi:DNA-binding response regulator [Halopseudomonas oceani]|uniref:DNA-binding response regulator n=1 Tax=Halopseudomonas oceani TaxID=1708783 RepID=A0A2P4ESY5_9GAMM|nr:DNA-binding response regulator [Halopseudomonas oceani]
MLVVDDHQLFIDGVRYLLQQLEDEVEVVECNNSASAIELLESPATFDLVLIDLVMPDLNGISIIQRLHSRGVCRPLVVMSGEDNPRTIKAAMDAGALGFIPKTFGSSAMLDALRQILTGELFLPEGMEQQIAAMPPRRSAVVGDITPRQQVVLELMALGYSNRQIATSLFLTEHTVKAHIRTLFQTLQAANRTDCVQLARRRGLLQDTATSDN